MSRNQNVTTAAAVRMTMMHPFWTELFYSMNIVEVHPDDPLAKRFKTQGTDGRTIWVNVEFFKSIPLEQQVSELVHEICHKAFLHTTRRGMRNPSLWNTACDYVVNAMMAQNNFVMDATWLLDMQYLGWSAEKVYSHLEKQQREGQGSPGTSDSRMDIEEFKGSPEEKEVAETQIKMLVDKALATAKHFGNVPVGMEQATLDIYEAPREPWYNALHRYMQSLTVANYNWAKLNKRTLRTHGLFAPLNTSEALGVVALFIDTSGSCFQRAQQANFAGHLNAILAECKPLRVHVYYFDTAVYTGPVVEAGEIDIALTPRGAGGTNFIPIFQALEDDDVLPEVCIILTDLEGSFPSQGPDYPVVWASIYEGENYVAPFGETIYVE
jgi:predicted metal-dependent peptidase